MPKLLASIKAVCLNQNHSLQSKTLATVSLFAIKLNKTTLVQTAKISHTGNFTHTTGL